ncbi:BRCT domain-containing protein [Gottfriedia sp. NPDC057991]|uniref:BRCT domain-containing protein n=1 Tax=Gottfriedia sp. NPDC057991 TaxID=3346298 RepID=UPI0036DDDD8A
MNEYILVDIETGDFQVESGIKEVACLVLQLNEIVHSEHFYLIEDANRIQEGYGKGYATISSHVPFIEQFQRLTKRFPFPIIAHNVPFDRKFLVHYGWISPDHPTVDSIDLIRAIYPDLPSYSLETCLQFFEMGTEQTHTAIDDVRQLFAILQRAYDPEWYPSSNNPPLKAKKTKKKTQRDNPEGVRRFMPKAELHKAINSLIGIINGMKFDAIVNDDEVSELVHWCNLHRFLANKPPFSDIIPVIDQALEDGVLEPEEMDDILWLCHQVMQTDDFNEFYDLVTSSIQQLEGILHGVLSDNELSDLEIKQLKAWLDERAFLKGTYPFDEIDSLIMSVLEDGVITEDERQSLVAFFSNFIDAKQSYNLNEEEMKTLQAKYSVEGICAANPSISFSNKTFCFTGASYRAKRNDFAELITQHGGQFTNSVTKKTNFLIVGGEGNPCWAFSCYGRKVEKAVQLRKAGTQVVIVHENDFWKQLEKKAFV